MDALQEEILNLKQNRDEIKLAHDTVHELLESKQKQVDHLQRELEEMRPQAEGISSEIQVNIRRIHSGYTRNQIK